MKLQELDMIAIKSIRRNEGVDIIELLHCVYPEGNDEIDHGDMLMRTHKLCKAHLLYGDSMNGYFLTEAGMKIARGALDREIIQAIIIEQTTTKGDAR